MSTSRLDAVMTLIGATADRSQRQLDRAEALARETEALRVTGRSGDRVVSVTVDGVGQMVDIDFGDGFATVGREALRAAVLAAHGQAKGLLTARVAEISSRIYGEDSAVTAMFTQSYRDRYGMAQEDER